MTDGRDGEADGIVVLVCMTCAREHHFEGDERPPADLTCEKCGNDVFRRFDDAIVSDEVRADFDESTGRDLDPADPAGEATRTDLHDLNNP